MEIIIKFLFDLILITLLVLSLTIRFLKHRRMRTRLIVNATAIKKGHTQLRRLEDKYTISFCSQDWVSRRPGDSQEDVLHPRVAKRITLKCVKSKLY